MRAVEEANARVQRMNNELLIARREAEFAKALKVRFAAMASNELRAPLNLILGFSSMEALSPERYRASLPEEYRADIDTIHRNAQHMATLIDDIVNLSQIEADRMPLLKNRVHLETDIIRKAVDTVRPLAHRKGLSLCIESQKDIPWILADPVRLRQALLNLLTNAVRFTEKGSIVVSAALDDTEGVIVSVEDTGAGIGPENLPKVFREFELLHLYESQEQRGTGLGLSITKHITELHGGRIWVESEKGKRSTFSSTIPLPGQTAVGRTVWTGERQAPEPALDACLVVHDDPAMVRILGRFRRASRLLACPMWREWP